MVRADVIELIAEQQPRGAFETVTETTRRVFCTVRSVTMTEAYTARSVGLDPEIVFVLSDYAEYKGEKLLTWGATRYRIVRTYVNGQQIELVCEKVTV